MNLVLSYKEQKGNLQYFFISMLLNGVKMFVLKRTRKVKRHGASKKAKLQPFNCLPKC